MPLELFDRIARSFAYCSLDITKGDANCNILDINLLIKSLVAWEVIWDE